MNVVKEVFNVECTAEHFLSTEQFSQYFIECSTYMPLDAINAFDVITAECSYEGLVSIRKVNSVSGLWIQFKIYSATISSSVIPPMLSHVLDVF